MALVQRFGKPTLFITFTANPNWDEVKREKFPTQSAADRPDLVARVFYLKLKDLQELIKDDYFGPYLALVSVIEYQKRGLPHVHIVVWLKNEDFF